MASLEKLALSYERYVSMPWAENIAEAKRVWFAVYDPADERRLRAQVGAFEMTTRQAGHGWLLCDVTNSFPEWMAGLEYKETYFRRPSDMTLALKKFERTVAAQISEQLQRPGVDEHTVVAVMGLASLFGVARVSSLVESVSHSVQGRLLVFFPGHTEDGRYRLLDARDGWNYLAVPITGD